MVRTKIRCMENLSEVQEVSEIARYYESWVGLLRLFLRFFFLQKRTMRRWSLTSAARLGWSCTQRAVAAVYVILDSFIGGIAASEDVADISTHVAYVPVCAVSFHENDTAYLQNEYGRRPYPCFRSNATHSSQIRLCTVLRLGLRARMRQKMQRSGEAS